LDAIGDRQAVGIGGEFVGIAKQTVKGGEFIESVVEIIGVVDGGAFVMRVVVGYQQIGVFADRLRIV